jgi:CAAX protease family protein
MADWNPSPVPDSTPAAPPAIPEKSSAIRQVFKGPEGIRAGWRFLMYMVMFVAIGFALMFIVQHSSPPTRAPALWSMLISEFLGFVAAVIPAVVMGRIERRSFGDYGLPLRSAFGKLFWVGALWGIVALTILILTLRGLQGFYFGGLALHGMRIVKFAVFWGVVFLLVGFFEEFLIRGYTQFTLACGIGFWPAAVLLSGLFGALHLGNPGEAWVGALAAGLIGLFFCLTLRRTGNLWFAVGFHMSFDWGETFLYSVPNSGTKSAGHLFNSSFQGPRWLTGGTVGPEGSVLVFVLIALLWVVFDRMYREVKYKV